MTWRDLLIGVGIGALALAALALVFAMRVVMRRARAGQRQRWVGLVFRGALVAGLVAIATASLVHLPPPDLVNRLAPSSADATVAFVSSSRDVYGKGAVVGVSARDGATHWRRALDDQVEALLPASAGMLLAQTFGKGIYALRESDGALLWHNPLAPYLQPGLIVPDGARVYALASAAPARGSGALDVVALDLQSGAQIWRAPLPATINQSRQLVIGDGLALVAGMAGPPTQALNPWAVLALDAATGARRWQAVGAVERDVYGQQVLGVFVAAGNVVVVPNQGAMTGLRERDGGVAWGGPPGLASNHPAPFYDLGGGPDIIAVTASGATLYALAWPLHWPTDASGRQVAPPVWLAAINAASGAILWRRTPEPISGRAWTRLAAREGVLLSGNYITPDRGYGGYAPTASLLTAYDAASGRVLWQDNTPRVGISWDMTPLATPLSSNGAIYLMGIQADPYVQDVCVVFCPGVTWLYAVNLHSGAPWWRVRMGYATLGHLVF